jgi:hypothetical protein
MAASSRAFVKNTEMPRFFIDLHDQKRDSPRPGGADYPHLEDALDEAKASARDMVRQYMQDRVTPHDTCVEVRDHQGRTVASLTVAEVLEHPSHPAFKQRCSDAPPARPPLKRICWAPLGRPAPQYRYQQPYQHKGHLASWQESTTVSASMLPWHLTFALR